MRTVFRTYAAHTPAVPAPPVLGEERLALLLVEGGEHRPQRAALDPLDHRVRRAVSGVLQDVHVARRPGVHLVARSREQLRVLLRVAGLAIQLYPGEQRPPSRGPGQLPDDRLARLVEVPRQLEREP